MIRYEKMVVLQYSGLLEEALARNHLQGINLKQALTALTDNRVSNRQKAISFEVLQALGSGKFPFMILVRSNRSVTLVPDPEFVGIKDIRRHVVELHQNDIDLYEKIPLLNSDTVGELNASIRAAFKKQVAVKKDSHTDIASRYDKDYRLLKGAVVIYFDHDDVVSSFGTRNLTDMVSVGYVRASRIKAINNGRLRRTRAHHSL